MSSPLFHPQAPFDVLYPRHLADLCANVRCSYGARCEDGHCVCPQHCPEDFSLVCASNGQEYDNECEMKRYACAQSLDLEKINDGVCEGSGSGQGSRL